MILAQLSSSRALVTAMRAPLGSLPFQRSQQTRRELGLGAGVVQPRAARERLELGGLEFREGAEREGIAGQRHQGRLRSDACVCLRCGERVARATQASCVSGHGGMDGSIVRRSRWECLVRLLISSVKGPWKGEEQVLDGFR